MEVRFIQKLHRKDSQSYGVSNFLKFTCPYTTPEG